MNKLPPNPDTPLTDAEWAKMKPMRGIDALPIHARRAIQNLRGRPALEHTKEQVSIRLDSDLLSALRANGKGWQTQVNAILRQNFLPTDTHSG